MKKRPLFDLFLTQNKISSVSLGEMVGASRVQIWSYRTGKHDMGVRLAAAVLKAVGKKKFKPRPFDKPRLLEITDLFA